MKDTLAFLVKSQLAYRAHKKKRRLSSTTRCSSEADFTTASSLTIYPTILACEFCNFKCLSILICCELGNLPFCVEYFLHRGPSFFGVRLLLMSLKKYGPSNARVYSRTPNSKGAWCTALPRVHGVYGMY